MKFWKDEIYFGDSKSENFLVSFKGRRFLLGDFGTVMKFKKTKNCIKGLTEKWSLPRIVELFDKGSLVT